MPTEHTPEFRIYRAETEDNELVITSFDGPLVRIQLRRVQACINACAGIPTEALEAGALGEAIAALRRAAHDTGMFSDVGQILRAALAKLEGK
jgi:hypothetical protein